MTLRAVVLAGLVSGTVVVVPGAERPPRPTLRGPEVLKVGWVTRSLKAADVDGDGLTDVAVLNNERGRVEIGYQLKPGEERPEPRRVVRDRWEPVVDDARFRREAVTTGVAMFDLELADLDGDGRVDLAYTGSPDGLTVRYQDGAGGFGRKRTIDVADPVQAGMALKAADLDADGRMDLVMVSQREIHLFRQGERGELAGPESIPLVDEGCSGLEVLDVDGDGRVDLVYMAFEKRDALRVRLQEPGGRFGAEQGFRLERPQTTLAQVAEPGRKVPAFAYVQQQTNLIEVFELVPAGADEAYADALRPRVLSNRAGGKLPSSYAMADLDGDGREDLVAADPDGAQVFVHLREPDGGFAPGRRFPSLAEVRSVAAADWDGDGRAEVFVASVKEQAIGVSSLGKDGRLGFPALLDFKGRPQALVAADLLGEGTAQLFVAAGTGTSRVIQRLRPAGSTVKDEPVALDGVRSDPTGFRVIPGGAGGHPTLVVTLAVERPRWLRAEAGVLVPLDLGAADRVLPEAVPPAALAVVDFGDGTGAGLLAGGTGFARLVRPGAGGAWSVVDQFNAREATAEVQGSLVVDLDGDRVPEVVLVDRKAEAFQVLRRGDDGVYSFAASVPTGRIDLVETFVLPREGGGRPDVVLAGRDRFWWLPAGRAGLQASSLATYETDLEGVRHDDVVSADLRGDGRPMLVGVDLKRGVVEFLDWARPDAWSSRVHFQVYQADPHFQGQRGAPREPREALAADVTGDGKADLVLLIHDRILVYPQR